MAEPERLPDGLTPVFPLDQISLLQGTQILSDWSTAINNDLGRHPLSVVYVVDQVVRQQASMGEILYLLDYVWRQLSPRQRAAYLAQRAAPLPHDS